MCAIAGVQDHEGLAFGTNDESKIGPSQFASASLYVGDLDLNVTDSELHDLFNRLALVVSVRVCRDSTTHRSLGYGYVNYCDLEDGLLSRFALFVLIFFICCLDLDNCEGKKKLIEERNRMGRKERSLSLENLLTFFYNCIHFFFNIQEYNVSFHFFFPNIFPFSSFFSISTTQECSEKISSSP